MLVLADLLDDALIGVALLDIGGFAVENPARAVVDPVADAAQHLGGAVDDRLEQAFQHGLRGSTPQPPGLAMRLRKMPKAPGSS